MSLVNLENTTRLLKIVMSEHIQLTNLIDSLQSGRDITKIIDLFVAHTTDEEELMILSGYPDFEMHKLEHLILTKNLKLLDTSLMTLEDLKCVLTKSFSEHIARSDYPIFNWLEENAGVAQR